MTHNLPRWLLPVWLPAAIVLTWQWAASHAILDPLFFPPPTVLLATIVQMARSGDLAHHAGATLSRAAFGFLFGSLAGILTGVSMGASRPVCRSLEPVIAAIYSTPKLTLLPMLMLLVGVGDMSRRLVIAASAFIIVTINTLDGVRGVRRHYIEIASAYGASSLTIFRRVYLPASAPQIFTGIRLAAGRALVVTLSVEMISAREGLGSLVWSSWETFSTEHLYVAVLTCAVLGAILHRFFRVLEAQVIPWKGKA
jgi:NitT/TauT family transport system permease protein